MYVYINLEAIHVSFHARKCFCFFQDNHKILCQQKKLIQQYIYIYGSLTTYKFLSIHPSTDITRLIHPSTDITRLIHPSTDITCLIHPSLPIFALPVKYLKPRYYSVK